MRVHGEGCPSFHLRRRRGERCDAPVALSETSFVLDGSHVFDQLAKNGAGKSTLVKALRAGSSRPTARSTGRATSTSGAGKSGEGVGGTERGSHDPAALSLSLPRPAVGFRGLAARRRLGRETPRQRLEVVPAVSRRPLLLFGSTSRPPRFPKPRAHRFTAGCCRR